MRRRKNYGPINFMSVDELLMELKGDMVTLEEGEVPGLTAAEIRWIAGRDIVIIDELAARSRQGFFYS